MKHNAITILISFGLLALWAIAMASVPRLINYQGVLADSGGNPITGTHDLTFAIYSDSAVSMQSAWTETHAGVEVDGGLFHVILGSTTPIPEGLFSDGVSWIGISVDDTPEMTPRQQITSVPWAFRAAVADSTLSGGGAGDGHSLDAADGDPTDVVFVTSGGDVYMNTEEVYVKKDVDGAVFVNIRNTDTGQYSSEQLIFENEHGPLARIAAYDNDHPSLGNKLVIANNRPNGSIQIETGNADRLSILTNGNVGIGVPSATEKLQVAGIIHSTTGGIMFPDSTVQTTAESNPGGLTLPFVGSTTHDQAAFSIRNTGAGPAIEGLNGTATNEGLLGGDIFGVYGRHENGHYAILGASTWGVFSAHSTGSRGYLAGSYYGIAGYCDTVAVHGYNSEFGHYGRLGTRDWGVTGRNGTSGNTGFLAGANQGVIGYNANGNVGQLGHVNYGVYGSADSAGYGGYFDGRVYVAGEAEVTGFKMPTGASDGYVLTSDATGVGSWQSLSASGDGDWQVSGSDMYSAVSGNVGIGTSSPAAPFHVADGLTVLFGADTTGAGSKLIWLPAKSAFRAGEVLGGEWNWTNVGEYSTAMGTSIVASGQSSTAMGVGNTASGYSSTAIGSINEASGDYSTAMGNNTTAANDYSTAMGSNTSASGIVSTAMGSNTSASGDASTAMGSSTSADGGNSTAMGSQTTASGSTSIAMGLLTTASGMYSTAMGSQATASGTIATAMGYQTQAESYASTAIGQYNRGGGNPTSWDPADPLFEIGNGTSIFQTNAVTVLKNGNVGIKTDYPDYLLEVGYAGDGTEARANAWNLISSREYKENIESFTPSEYQEVLAKVKNTEVVKYQFANDEKNVQHIGVIAEASPKEIVAPDGKAVSLGDYCAFLLAAIKAQQERIEKLEVKIVKLESKLQEE